jgi:serine protease Do
MNNNEINNNEIVDVPFESNVNKDSNTSPQFNEVTSSNSTNKKEKHKKNKILSYALIAILCSTFSGVGASIGTMKIMNKNSSAYSSVKNTSENVSLLNENNKKQTNMLVSNVDKSLQGLTIPQIAKKVGPAVVGVSTKGFPRSDVWGFQVPASEGMGSGIIFSDDGYILTNYHVINNAQTIKVIFNTGKEANAKLINYDQDFDVAVIKVTDNVQMPAVAEFGDSDSLEIGELCVAIGNPLGKELLGSVTDGIISALDRSIDDRDIKFIQTNAAINPGNSGGPLVNRYGEVIGINTEKSVGNGIEGLGFAIPFNQIKPKIENLVKPRLMIGIRGREVDKQISASYNLPIGIYVQDVQEFSPAERAGIKPGDVIINFDGKNVKTFDELNEIKSKHESDDIINVTVVRLNEKVKLKLQLTT